MDERRNPFDTFIVTFGTLSRLDIFENLNGLLNIPAVKNFNASKLLIFRLKFLFIAFVKCILEILIPVCIILEKLSLKYQKLYCNLLF